jgi:hypothetical protein
MKIFFKIFRERESGQVLWPAIVVLPDASSQFLRCFESDNTVQRNGEGLADNGLAIHFTAARARRLLARPDTSEPDQFDGHRRVPKR